MVIVVAMAKQQFMETAVKRGSVVITVTIKRKYKVMPTEKTRRDKTEIMYCTTQSKTIENSRNK